MTRKVFGVLVSGGTGTYLFYLYGIYDDRKTALAVAENEQKIFRYRSYFVIELDLV